MRAWRQIAFAAAVALWAMWAAAAQASVTYVFMPSTLARSSGSYTQPLPITGPIGSLTITDQAYAERKIDSHLDVLNFFFDVNGGYPYLPINNLTPCQKPTVIGGCSPVGAPIAMQLSESGEIESGKINYYGGSYYGHDLEYFFNDRILQMNANDGEWTGRQVTEAGQCGQNPGCLFTGHWVPIPEPATASLLSAGFGLAVWLRRRRNADHSTR